MSVTLTELFSGEPFVIGVQLVVALVLGMFLGAERTVAHKTAGLRTYGLVSMGATLFVIAGGTMAAQFGDTMQVDLTRIIAGIVSGVGFLGAGMIIFKDATDTVTGLTTAAGLWIAAGIGIAVGFQQYILAVFASLCTFIVFTFFWHIEHRIERLIDNPPPEDR